ncbi:MAG: hypothetical protein JWQ09_716 [Segetibacter sp.]|nr:hypothetical protein [Segetibacter sp.]
MFKKFEEGFLQMPFYKLLKKKGFFRAYAFIKTMQVAGTPVIISEMKESGIACKVNKKWNQNYQEESYLGLGKLKLFLPNSSLKNSFFVKFISITSYISSYSTKSA